MTERGGGGGYPHWYSCRQHGNYPGFNPNSPGCPGCNKIREESMKKFAAEGRCFQCGKKPCACPYIPDVGR